MDTFNKYSFNFKKQQLNTYEKIGEVSPRYSLRLFYCREKSQRSFRRGFFTTAKRVKGVFADAIFMTSAAVQMNDSIKMVVDMITDFEVLPTNEPMRKGCGIRRV